LGLAGKKTTVKPGARLAARKRAGAKSVQPKSVQPKSVQPKSVQPKSAQPKSGHRKPVQRPDKGSRAPDAVRTENARLAAELRTALARQAATSDILRVISGSPTDVQPVFDAIVLTAARLLRCDRAFIQRCDGATFWTVASAGPKGRLPIMQSTKAPLDPDANFPSRAIVAKKTLHLPDWSAIELPEFERQIREIHGTNSALYMPLLRAGECIGLLCIIAKRANMFGESEIALAEAFRDQALIAIENTRLFNETQEALEQQTATAEVLQVINASPGVLAPVFDAIVDKAARLCEADGGALWLVEGDMARATGGRGGNMPEPFYEYIANESIPVEYLLGRNAQDRPFIHTADLKATKPYQDGVPFFVANVDLGRVRTVLTVPLKEGGTIVGAFTLVRWEVRLFTDKQIALVQSFAAQAQIAMKNANLINETREALERQTATAEILKVIASSPSDVQPVFDAIASSANTLLGGLSTAVHVVTDDALHLMAFTPTNPAGDANLQASYPRSLSTLPWGAQLRNGEIVQVGDTEVEWAVLPSFRDVARMRGFRSILRVPLLRDGATIGAINVTRTEPGQFATHHVQLLQTFADQAVIAIENVRLFNETKEALERQTATADILKVIASSPSDVQPVFEKIVDSAARLFEPCAATIVTLRDGEMHWNATAALRPDFDVERARSVYPLPFAPDRLPSARAIAERRIVEILDSNAPDTPDATRRAAAVAGFRSITYVPLINDNKGIGTIILTHPQAGFRLSEAQLALLQTFADQAVIAIENVRLFNETREALERQTATADILKVIAGSPSDVQPVFEAIAASAKRLIGGFSGTVWRIIDGVSHLAAFTPTNPAADEVLKASFPRPLAEFFQPFDLAQNGELVQVADTETVSDSTLRDVARARGFRSVLFAPLMSDGAPIGLISVTRVEPGSFSAHHVQLLQTFADQAIIAIQNARLFNETREALERQTATADILKVIASSPSDVQPVFQAIAERSKRLVDALSTTVFRLEDGVMHLRAFTTTTPEADATLNAMFPAPLSDFSWGEAISHGGIHRVVDTEQEIEGMRELARQRGYRSMLFVPLLRDGTPIGVIAVTRVEPGPFIEHHVQLLQTFADQAVIAIENVRLFDEVQAKTGDLEESLQQQTATADVLEVISRSAFDLTPVFETVAESSVKLCGSEKAIILRFDGELLRTVAAFNAPHPLMDWLQRNPIRPGRHSVAARAGLERRTIHVQDVLADPEHTYGAKDVEPFRTVLGVPMLKGDDLLGVILVYHDVVRPFTDKQIALVETFADQAVIAIENVRLFEEVQAKTRDLTEALTYQTGSSNILKVIASSPTDVGPVLKAIVENACELCEAPDALVRLREGDALYHGAHHGPIPVGFERRPLNRDFITSRAVVDKVTIHVHDVLSAEGDEFPEAQRMSRGLGTRTFLSVPLLRENESIGVIALRRTEVNPFSERQIALLQTFADQAVIAIGNVRLFDEVQARTKELSQSLDELRTAQDRLVQTEKLASLGQLTAGIAHEIKNPLNFVNNFSALSAELVDELNDTLKPAALNDATRKEVDDLTQTLKDNLEKVVQHGKRADSIVKNMLLHSREGSGEHRPTDINALLDESLNLAYHGARAEKREFNVTLQRDFDVTAGTVEVFPQEITRVFLNLISNGFYAVTKRKTENGGSDFEPAVTAATRNLGSSVEIRIRDNGTGIPAEVREKMFNPFFTTKPAGEGTGLGLSMSHDIIVKQHGGSIDVETEPGQFTEFRIVLPRASIIPEKRG
jgi:GAF domain-containing protein